MNSPKPPSVRALARDLGVSAMTVSRALHGTGPVDEATRAKVVKRALALGYAEGGHPQPVSPDRRSGAAQVLYLGRSTIESEMQKDTPFHSKVHFHLQAALEARGKRVVLADPEGPFPAVALGAPVWVLTNESGLSAVKGLPRSKTRRQFIAVETRNPLGLEISMDDDVTASAVARLLHDHGHETVGVLGSYFDPSNIAQLRRLHAFEKAWKGKTVILDLGRDSLALEKHLARADHATAIYATGGYFTLTAHQCLKKLGLSLPADMSLVGFDQFGFYRHLDLDITRVCADLEAMARELFHQVERALGGETFAAGSRILLPPLWETGKSVGPARAGMGKKVFPIPRKPSP